MHEILALLNDAAAQKDWVVLAILGAAVIVPVVLKALGKHVPLVDTVIEWVVAILKARKKALPPTPEGEVEGVAKVLPIKDVSEQPKPMDELK